MKRSWLEALGRFWKMRRLREPYRSLLDKDDGLLVSIDCETTSLNVKEAELLSIAAVCIDERRIRTSDAFYALVAPRQAPNRQNVRVHGLRPCDCGNGSPLQEVLPHFLQFVRGRTLVGYYLQYDLAVLNKNLRPLMGAVLPNRRIEVSGRYYDWRFAQYPGAYIDLRWETMVRNLRLPALPRHDAMNDAITTAMMYLALQARGHGAHRLPKRPTSG